MHWSTELIEILTHVKCNICHLLKFQQFQCSYVLNPILTHESLPNLTEIFCPGNESSLLVSPKKYIYIVTHESLAYYSSHAVWHFESIYFSQHFDPLR